VDGLTVNLLMMARALARCGEGEEAQAVLARAAGMVERLKLARLGVDLNETRAELHECGALPVPPGETQEQAAARLLEAALEAGRALEGWQPSSRLLLRLARAWAAVGDAKRSFEYAEQAYQVLHRENLRRATNAAAVMRARSDMERDRAELAHQRSLIAALRQASLTDPLTGLHNHRAFHERLRAELQRAIRVHDAFPMMRPGGGVLYALALEYARHGDLRAFLRKFMPDYSRSHLGRFIRKMFQQEIERELRMLEEFVLADQVSDDVGENLIAAAEEARPDEVPFQPLAKPLELVRVRAHAP